MKVRRNQRDEHAGGLGRGEIISLMRAASPERTVRRNQRDEHVGRLGRVASSLQCRVLSQGECEKFGKILHIKVDKNSLVRRRADC